MMLTPLVYIEYTRKVCVRLHEPLHTNGMVFIYLPATSYAAMSLLDSLNFAGSRNQKQSVVRRLFQYVSPTPFTAPWGKYGVIAGAKVRIIFGIN